FPLVETKQADLGGIEATRLKSIADLLSDKAYVPARGIIAFLFGRILELVAGPSDISPSVKPLFGNSLNTILRVFIGGVDRTGRSVNGFDPICRRSKVVAVIDKRKEGSGLMENPGIYSVCANV